MNILPSKRLPHARTSASTVRIPALLRRSSSLRRLYGHAAGVSEPGLRLVLNENASTLDLLITDLQAQRRADGLAAATASDWRDTTHRSLTSWLMHATPRSGSGWIQLLSHRERALLQAFELAIAEAAPPAASALRRQLPRLHSIQLDLDTLAGITH